MNQTSTLRELTDDEISQVSGGILPLIAAIGSFATHHTVRSLGQYVLSRSLSAYGVYNGAIWWDNQY